MPPSDTTPQGTIRYLTRILAAVAKDAGGEIRIKRKLMRQIDDSDKPQYILEELDSDKDEVVLRFDSKLPTIYPLGAETSTPSSQTVQPQRAAAPPPQPSPKSAAAPQSSLPFTEEQLARAEQAIAKQKTLLQIKRERPPAF